MTTGAGVGTHPVHKAMASHAHPGDLPWVPWARGHCFRGCREEILPQRHGGAEKSIKRREILRCAQDDRARLLARTDDTKSTATKPAGRRRYKFNGKSPGRSACATESGLRHVVRTW
jgi:hypothetical protein